MARRGVPRGEAALVADRARLCEPTGLDCSRRSEAGLVGLSAFDPSAIPLRFLGSGLGEWERRRLLPLRSAWRRSGPADRDRLAPRPRGAGGPSPSSSSGGPSYPLRVHRHARQMPVASIQRVSHSWTLGIHTASGIMRTSSRGPKCRPRRLGSSQSEHVKLHRVMCSTQKQARRRKASERDLGPRSAS